MNKKIELIKLYCTICQYYDTKLLLTAQRLSNNFCPKFTDEECITIYLWGLKEQKFNVKAIYNFIKDYYNSWFPDLPSYQAFNKRICSLYETFSFLAELVINDLKFDPEITTYLIDSLPIVLASEKRSSSAKVARDFCNKSFCASKNIYYYGVKLHILGQSNYKTIPKTKIMYVTPASENDLTIAKYLLENTYNIRVYGDKAFNDRDWNEYIKQQNNVNILTPVKHKNGQKYLDSADNFLSKAVSRVRQPIEVLNNWLIEKTNIQKASKVRSYSGLMSFIFARIVSVYI